MSNNRNVFKNFSIFSHVEVDNVVTILKLVHVYLYLAILINNLHLNKNNLMLVLNFKPLTL